jgi:hypothetical protein
MLRSYKLSLQHDSFGLHKTRVCPHPPPPLHLQPSPASIHGARTKPIKVAFSSTSCHSDDNISLENGNDWSGSFIVLQPWAKICEKIALMSATTSKFWELMIGSTDWKTGNYHFSPRKMCNHHKDLSSAMDDNSNSKLLAVVDSLQPANRWRNARTLALHINLNPECWKWS